MSQLTLQCNASHNEVGLFQGKAISLPCSDSSKLDNVNLTTSKMPEVFRHEPLDLDPSKQCIRLLKVTSTSSDDTHYELLNNVRLRDQPRFVALSYEWGHDSPLFPVKINGKSLYIRRNLYAFLQRFIKLQAAYPDGVGLPLLWIDAICINQADNLERNQQVPQMKRIYTQAEEVLLWLGDPAPFSNEAVLAVVVQGSEVFNTLMREAPELLERPLADMCPANEAPSRRTSSFRFLLPLTSRTYWARIWIVQEILSSRRARILCGEYLISFEQWAGALRYGATNERSKLVREALVTSSAMQIAEQWILHRSQTRSWGILNLMIKFMASLASDRHDKVYALLGISDDVEHLTVDYDAPPSLAVIQAIGTTSWNTSSSQFDTLCQFMGISQIQAHAGLDLDVDVTTAMRTSDPRTVAKALVEVEQRLRKAYVQQVVMGKEKPETELVDWSLASRVKLCSCNSCLKAELSQKSCSAQLRFLYTSPDFCLMQPFRSKAISARPMLIYNGKEAFVAFGQRYYSCQYMATAVFIVSDADNFPALLLYFDPDMPRWHFRREITLSRTEEGVPSHQVVVKRQPMRESSLAQSCRWYAHVLSSRREIRSPLRAIGHQVTGYGNLDDLVLHGFLPPDFEPFEVSSGTRTSILHPSRSDWHSERYHQFMSLLQPRVVYHEGYLAHDVYDKIYSLLGILSDLPEHHVDYGNPARATLLNAIACASQLPESKESESICRQVGLGTDDTRAALGIDTDQQKDHEQMWGEINALSDAQFEWSSAITLSELAEWSRKGRVVCCTCVPCQREWPRTKSGASNVYHHFQDGIFHRSERSEHASRGRPVCRPYWTLRTQAIADKHGVDDPQGSYDYLASAVFIPRDENARLLPPTEDVANYRRRMPLLLLYHDPAMVSSLEQSSSARALDTSMRHLAHILPSKRRARQFRALAAIGVQSRPFEETDEVLLRYGPPPPALHGSSRRGLVLLGYEGG